MKKLLAAHIRDNGDVQTIIDHLEGTAKLAGQFGSAFNNGEYAFSCGLVHDIGKYSNAFQKRIWEAGPKVDHSTAGAIEFEKAVRNFGRLMAYCVAGHHTGLPNGGSVIDLADEATLSGRLKRKVPQYDDYSIDLHSKNIWPQNQPTLIPLMDKGFSISLFVRMIFSCLVDADFLDTEKFMLNGKRTRNLGDSIDNLYSKLIFKLSCFKNPTREIDKKRNEILEQCLEAGKGKKGLYTLTVPTGGGKTISSMAFALEQAVKHKMERVIYVIPYTSIIEQNASEFKNIFGNENVLEHHSNFEYKDTDDGDETEIRQKLATENWDSPIVVTTNVQFFESMFSRKTSRCRKLHNIANSVVIFDESQMLPLQYLKPCVRCIAELVHNYECTVVLCSATQPMLGDEFPTEVTSKEICKNTDEMYMFFIRAHIKNAGVLTDEELISRINLEHQILCIVNTRKQAQNVFAGMIGEGCFHLSTLMHPNHRRKVISKIKQRLEDGMSCRVVSTSLIEAGVNVDFSVVYRSVAGLDSEIQAAGRCNREGRRPAEDSFVYIFSPENKYQGQLPGMLKRPISITQIVERQFGEDVNCPAAISEYFRLLYQFSGLELDVKSIVKRLEEGVIQGMNFPFVEISNDFRMIENDTYTVMVPSDAISKGYADRLRSGERTRDLFRKIQMYAVNLYKKDYEALCAVGVLEQIDKDTIESGLSVLTDLQKYHDDMGLLCPENGGAAIFT